ncbi:MAG: GAF domain-containing sensor histidine kinase [Chloroflexi bacterium]|nr:GAF domain-containing sensor histidine kinase [Chloroflexota bacterium]
MSSRTTLDRRELGWRRTVRALRLASIIFPIVLLIGFDVLRHTVLFAQLHSWPAFIIVYLLVIAGVVGFAYTMFGFIGRLHSKVMEQNRQLAALNKIARASAEKPTFQELLKTSLDEILASLRADAGLICLVDQEKGEHSAVCHRGFSDDLVNRIRRAKLGDDPIASEVVRTGRPVVLEKVFEHPPVAEMARREGIRSGISAPLKYEGKVNGILAIATRKERHFSRADRSALESIGGQLGMAIRNAVLYEHFQVQNRELGALLAVGRAVTSSFDLDELLSKSLDTVVKVTAVDAAEVWLVENQTEVSLRSHCGGYRDRFFERTNLRVGEGTIGVVAETRQPFIVHDLPAEPSFVRRSVVEAGFKTFGAIPLQFQNRLVGVLAVGSLSPDVLTDQSGISLLQGIGEWLSLAIENSHLYRQVQDLAVLGERERLAREMHDGMAQLLGYINTQTIAVKKLLSNSRVEDAREELKKMEEVTRDLYADVREGIVGLRIASSHSDSLLTALRQYADRYTEMSSVQVEIQVDPDIQNIRLAPSAEIQLMRIIQEALTNVRKHSKTADARVTFQRAGGELHVTIADSGQGFDLMRLPSTGWPRFGLQTMRERAEAIGGALRLDTAPGRGTRVEIRLPLRHDGRNQGL